MSEPKVSIIIPVYNVEKYILRCLDSLKNQTLGDIEIIFVDDESPDNCPAILDKSAEEDSRIKVVHKKNGGAGLARNSGLKIAKGKYIGFVDADDFVKENMYEVLYNKAEKYGSDLIISGVRFVDGNMFGKEGDISEKLYFKEDTHFENHDEIKKLKLGILGSLPYEYDDSRYGMSVWKNLFKREIIEQNNLKFESEREMLSEDALFMIDYINCINKATGIKDSFYNYCRNEDSISKAYKRDRLEKSLVFIKEAEKRLGKDVSTDEYRLYSDRFWQAFCRVLCSQEIMYSTDNGIEFSKMRSRLKEILTHSQTEAVFKRYPLSKLPLKQALFAYAMKYKLYRILKRMVNLRSR